MWDRPLVSEESFVACRVDDETCEGQVTSNRYCDTHRPKCTCEGGHVLLCPAHAEEAQELMARMVADDAANALDHVTNRNA